MNNDTQSRRDYTALTEEEIFNLSFEEAVKAFTDTFLISKAVFSASNKDGCGCSSVSED